MEHGREKETRECCKPPTPPKTHKLLLEITRKINHLIMIRVLEKIYSRIPVGLLVLEQMFLFEKKTSLKTPIC